MAFQVTPIVAVIIIAIILIVAVLLAIFIKYDNYQQSRIYVFINTLAGLGIIMTFLFYYSIVSLQEIEQKLFVVNETSQVSTSLADGLLKQINDSTPLAPHFTSSLLPLNPLGPITSPIIDSPVLVSTLSTRIFLTWQQILISSSFVMIEPVSYITMSLQFCSSATLKDQWNVQYINLGSDTQHLGDLLFQYSSQVTENTPSAYQYAAKQLLNENQIFKK